MTKPACPNCNSKELEISMFYDNNDGKSRYTRVWRLRCFDCGFDKTQAHPFFWRVVKNMLI